MTLEEIDSLIKVLRANGVTKFKSPEISIKLNGANPVVVHSQKRQTKLPKEREIFHGKLEEITIPPVEEETKHTVDAVRSLLRMSPEELVDRMFPLEEVV